MRWKALTVTAGKFQSAGGAGAALFKVSLRSTRRIGAGKFISMLVAASGKVIEMHTGGS